MYSWVASIKEMRCMQPTNGCQVLGKLEYTLVRVDLLKQNVGDLTIKSINLPSFHSSMARFNDLRFSKHSHSFIQTTA